MKNWPDAKKFIFEDLCIYTIVIICAVGADCIYNFFNALGFSDGRHPVHLGAGQIAIAIAFTLLLVRKINQWIYWK